MTCSFLIATYNRKEVLEKALLSVVNMAQDNDEIIINDDGSNEDTINFLTNFANEHPNVKLYTHENKGGIYKNMHYGFSLCTKDIIIVCDSDDISLKERRDVIATYFEKHLNIDCIYHNGVIIDENDDVTCNDFFKQFKQKKSFYRIFSKASFYGALMCFRKSFIEKYNDYILKTGLCWDITLGVIAYKLKTLAFIKDKLIKYRRWTKNISAYKKRKLSEKIKTRLSQIKFYFKFKK